MLSPFPSRRELVTVVQRVWNNEKPVEHWCCVAWYKIICLRQAVVCLAAAAQPLSPWVDNAPLPPVSASAALDPEFLDIREDGVLNDEMNVQALCDGVLMEMNRRSGYEVERLRDWIEEVERDVLGIQSDDPSIDLPKTLMVTANLVSSIARTYRQIAWEFHTTLRFQLPDTYGTATDRAARRAARETYRAITETVTRLQHEIRDVADSARNAIATRQLMAAQAQESAAREQQEISERFQRLAAGFASVVLIPALVATVFAADVPIPHRGTFSALVALVALMAASAAGSWVLVVGRLQPMSTVWKRLLIAAAVVGIVIGVLGLAGVFGGHHTVARPKHARHRTQH